MVMSMKRSKDGGYYTRCMKSDEDRAKGTDDYYTGAKEPPGTWMVYSALDPNNPTRSALGVVNGKRFDPEDASVDIDKFHNLVKGYHAETGAPVVQNPNDKDRMGLIDFCLSPPKPVSSVWSQAEPKLKDKIETIQTESSAYAMNFLGTKLISRTGKKGVVRTPVAAAAFALFGHGSSRANDPQLHTHCCLLNAAERMDGGTGAVDELDAMQWQGATASLYHMKMAWELRNLGFEIEKKGKIFDIKGVPEEVNAHFSKRTNDIKKNIEEKQAELGTTSDVAKASYKLRAVAALENRDGKNELTREELQSKWIEEGKKLGFTHEQVEAIRNMGQPVEITDEELMEEANKALWAIHENSAIFTEPTLLTMVAVQLTGLCHPDRAQAAVERLKNEVLLSTEVHIKLNGRTENKTIYTTKQMVGIERVMLNMAQRMDGKHLVGQDKINAAILAAEQSADRPLKLSEEQNLAVMAPTRDYNAVTVIEGTAGAGKTTVMQVIARAYEREGYRVEGLSMAWKSAKNLQIEAELEAARAITGWVKMVDSGEISLDEKTVIVLDEAGMVGALQMKQVLERAEQYGSKVILAGDTRQQKSVSAGDPLRCIVKEIGSTRLDTIRRQSRLEDRTAVKNFFSGKAEEGLKPYLARGNVNIGLTEEETNTQLIKDWMKSRSEKADKSHLIIAAEKITVDKINRMAHQARVEAGELGEEVLELNCVDSSSEVSESGEIKPTEFRIGDVVALRRNETKPPKGSPHAQQEAQKFSNRDLGIVIDMNAERGVLFVKLDDSDRTIMVNAFNEKWQNQKGEALIQHGYALTTYSSQGLTRDQLFVRDGLSMNRSSAGVAMSRHRDDCHLYVNKTERWEQFIKPKFVEDYVPLKNFSNQECLDQLAKSWSRESIKESTLDYQRWVTAQGFDCDLEAERIIELAKARLDQVQRQIDQITKQSKLQDVRPMETMDVQRDPEYSITYSADPKEREHLEKLYERDSHYGPGVNIEIDQYQLPEAVREEAVEQGFMRPMQDGKVAFVAKGPNGKPVQALDLHGNKAGDYKDLPAGDTWPQYLLGHPENREVHVVKTPLEALQLRSLQIKNSADWKNDKDRSTIIVAGLEGRGLESEKARELAARGSETAAKKEVEAEEAKHSKTETMVYRADQDQSQNVGQNYQQDLAHREEVAEANLAAQEDLKKKAQEEKSV